MLALPPSPIVSFSLSGVYEGWEGGSFPCIRVLKNPDSPSPESMPRSVCMLASLSVCVCMSTSVWQRLRVCLHLYVSVCMSTSVCQRLRVCLCACAPVYQCLCVCVCMCVYVSVCVCVCVCVHLFVSVCGCGCVFSQAKYTIWKCIYMNLKVTFEGLIDGCCQIPPVSGVLQEEHNTTLPAESHSAHALLMGGDIAVSGVVPEYHINAQLGSDLVTKRTQHMDNVDVVPGKASEAPCLPAGSPCG